MMNNYNYSSSPKLLVSTLEVQLIAVRLEKLVLSCLLGS